MPQLRKNKEIYRATHHNIWNDENSLSYQCQDHIVIIFVNTWIHTFYNIIWGRPSQYAIGKITWCSAINDMSIIFSY